MGALCWANPAFTPTPSPFWVSPPPTEPLQWKLYVNRLIKINFYWCFLKLQSYLPETEDVSTESSSKPLAAKPCAQLSTSQRTQIDASRPLKLASKSHLWDSSVMCGRRDSPVLGTIVNGDGVGLLVLDRVRKKLNGRRVNWSSWLCPLLSLALCIFEGLMFGLQSSGDFVVMCFGNCQEQETDKYLNG